MEDWEKATRAAWAALDDWQADPRWSGFEGAIASGPVVMFGFVLRVIAEATSHAFNTGYRPDFHAMHLCAKALVLLGDQPLGKTGETVAGGRG